MKTIIRLLALVSLTMFLSGCMLEYEPISPRPYYYRPLDIYPLYHDYYYPHFNYHYHNHYSPIYHNPPPRPNPNIHYGPRHR